MASLTASTLLLAEGDWQARQSAHEHEVDALSGDRRRRVATGQTHPVDDFLWTYYSYRPARLRRWHPGAGVALLGASSIERTTWRWHRELTTDDGPAVTLDVGAFLADRGDLVRRTFDLLAATAGRTPVLGCFGMHEWAMVHGLASGAARHESWPLRLSQAQTDAVVEASTLRCTHFDAFRFFQPSARPLNLLQPTRDTQVQLEQPGCLHATMDLYKWAWKLTPAVPSSLLVRCFLLAREVRELDMRASPYDLRALGYEPVEVETAHGRAEYVAAQRELTARGQLLRAELLDVCHALLP
ncbi:MAG TPA: 3-methyladenine DNA glycosylase [Actinomycetales bacterium]|jgi:hypothetical protein